MASKARRSKKGAAAAPVQAPEIAVTKSVPKPLPDGFVRVTDDYGDDIVQPTPPKAVDDLLTVLATVATWERYPGDRAEWTPSQIRERGRPMPGSVVVTGRDAEGEPFEIEMHAHNRARLIAEWERRTGKKRTKSAPTIRRSPIDQRRELVDGLRTGFDVFVPQAIAAVIAAGGSAEPLRALERDPELCGDTVTAAVLELRRAVPKPEKLHGLVAAAMPDILEPMPDLGDAERKTLAALLQSPHGMAETNLLDSMGSDKRARTLLVVLRLIDRCGLGKKTKRGTYKLTVKGSAIARRIKAGE